MHMRKIVAKLGSCAFCHHDFKVNQEEILYDPNRRRAWHQGCPPIEMPKQSRDSSEHKTSESIKNAQSTPVTELPHSDLATAETTYRQNIMTTKTKTDLVESQVLPDL